MTNIPAAPSSIQPMSELFGASVSTFWATTYNVDLALFDKFLFGLLGEPPLNVVVLSDQRRLAASLGRVPPERVDTLAAINSRWLLRGVRLGGSFHAKSYLAITNNRAVLLVGSGNLSSGGLNDGHEVFTIFRSGTQLGDSALVTWRAWMHRVVEMVGDVTLAGRFRDLEERLPTLPLATTSSPLIHNMDEPISTQLIAMVRDEVLGRVDNLLLAAPFYDADANAVAKLVADLKPHKVVVYISPATSVNGMSLKERLVESGAHVGVQVYIPEDFVHAKLIAVNVGRQNWLLSGSANLSQAALIRTAQHGGNVELAVLARFESDQIAATFIPPGMTSVASNLDALTSLIFQSDEEGESMEPHVYLINATMLPDGRVETYTNPPAQPSWLLDDLTMHQPLLLESSGRTITAGPLNGRLVQVIDTNGDILSNRVVVDDPIGLTAVLTSSTGRPNDDKPPELLDGDRNTPLGQALIWLHQHLVMDVSERLTNAPTGGVATEEADKQSDDDLWQRLEYEHLVRDPRVSTYRHFWTHTSLSGVDPIIELLDMLRNRTPRSDSAGRLGRSMLSHLLEHVPPADQQENQPHHPWKLSARIRVRALNVLRRWANAQTDERLVWIDPLAPAANFAMIIEVLTYLQIERIRNTRQVELTDDDLNDLWLLWLRKFAGSGQTDGWLDQIESANLNLVQQRLPEWLPEAAAALCWLAVPPSSQRAKVIEWQPVISSALDHKLVNPTEITARYVSTIWGTSVTPTQIDSQLLHVVEFIDDALWCTRTNSELSLDGLECKSPPATMHLQLRLDVGGVPNALLDPRIVRLIVTARNYRRCDGVALYAADTTWRIVVSTGKRIAYLKKPGEEVIESTIPVTKGLLEKLAGSGGVLAAFFSDITLT